MTFDGTLGPAAYTIPSTVFGQPRISLRSRTNIPDPLAEIPGPGTYSPRRSQANTACRIRPDYYKAPPPEYSVVGPGSYDVAGARARLSEKPGQSLGGWPLGYQNTSEYDAWKGERRGATPAPNAYALPGAEAERTVTIHPRVKRSLRDACGTSAETPGPGAYDVEAGEQAQNAASPRFSMRWRPE